MKKLAVLVAVLWTVSVARTESAEIIRHRSQRMRAVRGNPGTAADAGIAFEHDRTTFFTLTTTPRILSWTIVKFVPGSEKRG